MSQICLDSIRELLASYNGFLLEAADLMEEFILKNHYCGSDTAAGRVLAKWNKLKDEL